MSPPSGSIPPPPRATSKECTASSGSRRCSGAPTRSRGATPCARSALDPEVAEDVERIGGERRDLAHRLEGGDGALDVARGVERRDHEAEARLALGDDRVAQAVAVDAALVEQIHDL